MWQESKIKTLFGSYEYVGQSFCIVGSFDLFFVMTDFLSSVFFTLLQLHNISLCVLALHNLQFEASSSTRLQILGTLWTIATKFTVCIGVEDENTNCEFWSASTQSYLVYSCSNVKKTELRKSVIMKNRSKLSTIRKL